jgi:hypothetical protein
MGRVEAPCVSKPEALCCGDIEVQTLVVVHHWSNVVSICCMRCPGCTGVWIVVDEGFGS